MSDAPGDRQSSPATKLLAALLVLAGAAVIFAGEFEVLPRTGATTAAGGVLLSTGVLVFMRARLT